VEAVPDSITITDNRTGDTFEVPIVNGGVSSDDWRKGLPNVFFYDPGFMATAACESSITELDGDNGILRYRGYPIEQLAEKSTYLEVAYLLIHGELPTTEQFEKWTHDITYHTFIHENMRKRFMEGFHYDAHPMGMLVSAVAALSTFYLDAKKLDDPNQRMAEIVRLIAKMPTLAACCHRFSAGMPFVYPDNDKQFTANFLNMMFSPDQKYAFDNPTLAHALDVLFILHADHEQNCSTTAMRVVGSSHADPYTAASAACAALYGPRHGGANEQVIRMLTEIGSMDNVPDFVNAVKSGKSGRLQGFGHRVYKNYDPRATIIKKVADEVFEITGKNPLLDIALKLEEVALSDEYFISRKLYPNVDFYSGLIYQAMGFPIDMFPVLFAIPRMSGWLAHWQELLEQDSRIARPRQLYIGAGARDYVPLDGRS
jgi:citrate synthase